MKRLSERYDELLPTIQLMLATDVAIPEVTREDVRRAVERLDVQNTSLLEELIDHEVASTSLHVAKSGFPLHSLQTKLFVLSNFCRDAGVTFEEVHEMSTKSIIERLHTVDFSFHRFLHHLSLHHGPVDTICQQLMSILGGGAKEKASSKMLLETVKKKDPTLD
ncbi:hypothetical protein [Exiguobacterium flavidum]|uniref:hypothetical protein n=1 Tax=Exiguobacterium flavidum TaxID=2184695 RepID=UPI000DF80781|nr:hypothetical protein [Exiguobacterium flavidum]